MEALYTGNVSGMLSCLTNDVAHQVNEGQVRKGKELSKAFRLYMNRTYREELTDMIVFENGDRAAAEYLVNGTYLQTDAGLAAAMGQTDRLPTGSSSICGTARSRA